MPKVKRKPVSRVLCIRGSFEPDTVTREELATAAEKQATAWLAEKNAREYVQGIEARLMAGAAVSDCEFEFDRTLQMVRSKKVKAG
ncbi:MAG: hypothetical protein JWN34_2002 [Bryobacterales bacterium]|nr:hypothetical protein [Bryobacterales bacterium]